MVAGLLLGAGGDVNAADGAGWRPLHLAALNNNLELMKQLIAQGADVTAANGEGLTPCPRAAEEPPRGGCVAATVRDRITASVANGRSSVVTFSRRPGLQTGDATGRTDPPYGLRSIVTVWIVIGLTGRSPGLLVGVLPIFLTTSMPSTTSPNTLCLLSSHGVGASVMKN